MAQLIKGDNSIFRSPGVYIREVDINVIRPITREQIKDHLRNEPELLSEIVYELRQEKIKKIKNKL